MNAATVVLGLIFKLIYLFHLMVNRLKWAYLAFHMTLNFGINFRAIISCIFMFEQGIILKNTEEEIIIRTLYEKKLKKCGKNAEKGAYNR